MTRALALLVLVFALVASPATANVPLTRISSDPFANQGSQHATEVEPDTFANGSTIVSAFQVGRFFDGGGTDIGFSRSTDGGSTWASGFLPGLTATSGLPGTTGAPYPRVGDARGADGAGHRAWLGSSIPTPFDGAVPTIFVSRSTDGGATWHDPVSIPQ